MHRLGNKDQVIDCPGVGPLYLGSCRDQAVIYTINAVLKLIHRLGIPPGTVGVG